MLRLYNLPVSDELMFANKEGVVAVFRMMSKREIEMWYAADFSEAFAENERKPLPDIFALIEEGRYQIWGLFDGEAALGYATLWQREGIPLVLLDYLGVKASLRNGGLGAQILRQLQSKGFLIVTESELPVPDDSEEENSIRLRRIGFYRRNGFTPSYEMATCGMRWQALLYGAKDDSLVQIMEWHRELYGSERTDVKIPLGRDEIPEMPYWMTREV